MVDGKRDLLAREALAHIPKILTLEDRNRHSPTYGCFDRNYWHYRIIDFPSGMAQEFVLPLALAHQTDIPGNPYFGAPAIREWAAAGIRYAAASAHADGSCDDYFPFERAGGAAAFSLLACLEATRLLGLDDASVRDFLARRADWLAGHHESGRLSNHQALIALCLELAGNTLGSERWKGKAAERVDLALSWQTDEGWFWEYEGCDPGYLTITLSILAWLHALAPDAPYAGRLAESLRRGADFAAHFVHPDGSFGGETGSRNTYNFFPHGFELIGRWHPPALAVTERILDGLAAGRGPCYADDHIIGHHTWNYLLAWRDFAADRPPAEVPADGRHWFPQAGLVVERRAGTALFAALGKGGTFKAFHDGALAASDTQFSVLTRDGRNAVGHLVDTYETAVGDDGIRVAGSLGWAKRARMTTAKLIVLRLVMALGGRLFPNLVRRFLQRMLITSKEVAPYRFERVFRWDAKGLIVEDRLEAPSWDDTESVQLGCDQTSIYVVMSRTFQAGQMAEWTDLTGRVRDLKAGEPLVLARRFAP